MEMALLLLLRNTCLQVVLMCRYNGKSHISDAKKAMSLSIVKTVCCVPPIVQKKNFHSKGICIVDKGRYQLAVVNLMGVVYLEALDCPFSVMDRILEENSLPKIILVDFHAEATGEKGGFAYAYDGCVSAIFGTHTHVQTSDEHILPQGTGFITDLGMTGPCHSVFGSKTGIDYQKTQKQNACTV